MALTRGTKLGRYEIHSPLGAGGMGEVYRARDTRLNRTVAIKILPWHLSDVREAKERFEREARAISSLNHPNICTLYDVGSENGLSYLVMECLEGETLADRLKRGPLPLKEVVLYGVDICNGLEKAHRTGVIHRDLKPGNIMLTKTGAKLMDFGLAKAAIEKTNLPSSLTIAETLTSAGHPLTEEGWMVGTFQYMSPEQLQGTEPNARSDIFSLGTVLYEMCTGKPAFEGKTTASKIAAILASEPKSVLSFQPLAPPALDHIVRNCLAKDPDERFQTAHDVKLQLKSIGEAGSLPGSILIPKRSNWIWPAVILLLLLAFFAVITLHFRNPALQPTVVRFSFAPPENVTVGKVLTFSPDGNTLAFVATDQNGKSQIWVRSLDSNDSRPLSGTEGAFYHFWAPDSQHLGFFAEHNLRVVSKNGGPTQNLCHVEGVVEDPRGADWRSDNLILFTPNWQTALFRTLTTSCDMQPVTTLEQGQSSHRWPQFLPDGEHFIFYSRAIAAKSGLYLSKLGDTRLTRLTDATSFAAYAEPGFLVFTQGKTLIAQPFDPKTLRMTGDPFKLADSIGYDPVVEGIAQFAVSRSGNLAFRSVKVSGVEMAWYDRHGQRLGTLGHAAAYQEPALSNQGTKLAVVQDEDIVIFDLQSGASSRLTSIGKAYSPTWSPDDRRIMFSASSSGTSDVYEQSISEPGGARLLNHSPATKNVMDWSPDGRYIIFDNLDTKSRQYKAEVYVMPLFGDRKPFVFAGAPFSCAAGRFSPDGRWIVYESDESGRNEVYVRAFPSGADKTPISVDGGTEPIWRGDGKEIFYLAANKKMMAVSVQSDGTVLRAKPPIALFQAPVTSVVEERSHYVPSKDGKRFLILAEPAENRNVPVNVVLNFAADLKKQ
jgi:serine/threonine protein kinase